MSRMRGQSMTEFAVGASVLSLLMLGALTIAGYQEADRRTAFTARQSAWQEAWAGGSVTSEAGTALIHSRSFTDPAMHDAHARERLVAEDAPRI